MLPPDLAALSKACGRRLGIDPGPGCPWEAVYQGDPLATEIFDALALVKRGVPWEDALGRPMTAVDRDAVLLVERIDGRITRMEHDAMREDIRKARESGSQGGGGA